MLPPSHVKQTYGAIGVDWSKRCEALQRCPGGEISAASYAICTRRQRDSVVAVILKRSCAGLASKGRGRQASTCTYLVPQRRLDLLRSVAARRPFIGRRPLRQKVFEKLCLAPKGFALAVADALDQTNEAFPTSARPPEDVNDIAVHRWPPAWCPIPCTEAYGVSHSHSMSSQDTRSVTNTTLNLPLPLMPLKGPVPPSNVTVPAPPFGVAFESHRANNL